MRYIVYLAQPDKYGFLAAVLREAGADCQVPLTAQSMLELPSFDWDIQSMAWECGWQKTGLVKAVSEEWLRSLRYSSR